MPFGALMLCLLVSLCHFAKGLHQLNRNALFTARSKLASAKKLLPGSVRGLTRRGIFSGCAVVPKGRLINSFLATSLLTFSSGTKLMATATATGAATMAAAPKEFFRKDYRPSPFLISDVLLDFQLDPADTVVACTSTVAPKGAAGEDLVLDGEDLELLSVSVDRTPLSPQQYSYAEGKLRISAQALPRAVFELRTSVRIHPEKNLALSGLYKSGSNLLCTQCEAMGFRRIAFHLDRPDVLSRYTVRLEGDKATYPLLLSNGNQVQRGDAPGGRHWALWEDPFPKPSYLFALVAGDLGAVHDTYTTLSGRVVALGIYSDKENTGKLAHAMYSIKESMRWDEATFGLECDLDTYNIVATNDFNMGAMENKGLNIFNSAYVLADSATATDTDYENILGVIGHEYFHNWTGNRVTCQDWFQLTLKEGLTVFRDQWFSADATSEAVKRIEDVRGLRSRQFAEDQGPMAHPIRPESYISMDNFYTATVYVKGAEVVRMYRTLLGEQGFKQGMQLYFARHDGQAVTCDDFRAAMADANGADLAQFERWYSQAGTPVVDVAQSYDAAAKSYSLTLKQRTPATPGQAEADKKPLLIPVALALLSPTTGAELVAETVLRLTEAEQTFTFHGVAERPVPSVFRGFSAPVKVNIEQSDAELAFLMAHDSDSFNRWDAGNRLATKIVLALAALPSVGAIAAAPLPALYVDAVRAVLTSCNAAGAEVDASLLAYALQLPDESTLSQEMAIIAPDLLHAARKHVKRSLVAALEAEFKAVYAAASAAAKEYEFSPKEVGRRRLRNTCLDFLSSAGSEQAAALAKQQFDAANCMTDKISATAALVSSDRPERQQALDKFHADANGDALVIDKWFAIQAMADSDDVLARVMALKSHKDFSVSNPNRFRSLVAVFSRNLHRFHAPGGEGYRFVADSIMEVDKLNPQVAARLSSAFSQWRRHDAARQALMRAELERIRAQAGLSKDTFEVVSRCLN